MIDIRNIFKGIVAALALICLTQTADAQKWAVSTNALSWANLGTINAEASVSASRHFSFNAGFTANPWEMTTPTDVRIMNRQYGGYVGTKYWPWHVYSEWWIGAKVQYKNFEQVGLLTSSLIQGDAFGAGLAAGYSLMIGSHVNLDFGLGMWGGRLLDYRKYKGAIESESAVIEQGPRNFIYLDNIMVSLVYVF